jgi:hypothetical protein
MGLDTEANLPENAKGKAIVALKDEVSGNSFLYALYIVYNGSTGEHESSILVKLTVGTPVPNPDPDQEPSAVPVSDPPPTPDSGLGYAGQVETGKNSQEIIPGYTKDSGGNPVIRLFIPAVGGRQQPGASNGNASNIMSVPAFGNWPPPVSDVVTHITGFGQTSIQNPEYFDIHALGVSTREDEEAVFYFLTSTFLGAPTPQEEGYNGFDYRIYKSTVQQVNAANDKTLAEINPDTAEIVDEGRVYSTFEPGVPFGVYYLNLLLQNADTAEGERIFVFLGSELIISGAANYKARALVFGDGEGQGHIGGKNVNSAILLAETIRQYKEEQSLKRGVRAARITIPASGEEDEQEEE